MLMRNASLLVLAGVIAAFCGGCGPREVAPSTPESKPGTSATPPDNPQSGGMTTPPSDPPPAVKLTVGKEPNYVNLIPKETPPTPKFPALDRKPGVVRGYVYDAAGKPLRGATVGVRSTLLGGKYSGASAESDDKGYYEVKVPQGVAEIYAAGYTVDYADGRAALALHPADGSLASFASADGAVEHFVLWSFGVADRDKLSENPRLSSNFYGGSLYVGHFTAEPDDTQAPPAWLRAGTEIEIALTPEGKLLDGTAGREFVIKKAVFSSGFAINNIPIGRYKLTAKRADGRPLLMKLNKPKGLAFGITPEETTEGAVLTLHPEGAKAGMVTPGRGGWEVVEVYVEIPTGK
jgi:hypothetical protein